MSKAARIKGKFDQILGQRSSSAARWEEMVTRRQGLTDRHVPRPADPQSNRSMRKMRLMVKHMTGVTMNQNEARKAELMHSGHMFTMNVLRRGFALEM